MRQGEATNTSLLDVESHFEFGQNWSDYANRIGDAEIEAAEEGLLALIPAEALKGASFLDIGSGSGLHALAAHRLGAASITAVDIDPDSVATTRRVLSAHDVSACIEQMSVFDMAALGQYDIVYSWGVLHHTGDMWRAVDAAAQHVKPGGLLTIALYQKTPMCAAWTVEKRLYTAAPEPVRKVGRGLYGSAHFAAMTLKGRNPLRYIREYRSKRGMSYWHDVHDWLGGYPYEASTPDETVAFLRERGFEPIHVGALRRSLGLLGTGCAQYTFRRTTG